MIGFDDLNHDDVYLLNGERVRYRGWSSYGTDSEGRKYGIKINVLVEGKVGSDTVEFDFADMKRVLDHRVRVGDLVDVRLADERTIRGTVTVIDREAERPYCVKGPDGGTAWFAAWEFERFLRADSVERAGASLAAVRDRIRVLEVELEALRLSEEVLEGVYL